MNKKQKHKRKQKNISKQKHKRKQNNIINRNLIKNNFQNRNISKKLE